ncbi:MAG: hypothetical protein AVDCRST_MAG33-2505, partial [uncultured Thermomicrobiales bacterium]
APAVLAPVDVRRRASVALKPLPTPRRAELPPPLGDADLLQRRGGPVPDCAAAAGLRPDIVAPDGWTDRARADLPPGAARTNHRPARGSPGPASPDDRRGCLPAPARRTDPLHNRYLATGGADCPGR